MSDSIHRTQLELFDLTATVEDVAELFPEIWQALESVVSPEVETRYRGLEIIRKRNAERLSPLVAYVLATRLDDEDIDFRLKVVQAVGGLFTSDVPGVLTSAEVIRIVKYFLGKMRQRNIFALLQVAEYQPSSREEVAKLLKACSYSGKIMADIFTDHKLPLEIRSQAINYVGYLGFMETIPRLERLREKLESRMNGQRSMPFVLKSGSEEINLLPNIRNSLVLLKSP